MGKPQHQNKSSGRPQNKTTVRRGQNKKGINKGGPGASAVTGFTNDRKKKTINNYKKLLRKEQRTDDLHNVINRQKAQRSGEQKPDHFEKLRNKAELIKKNKNEEWLKKQQEREEKSKKAEEAKAEAAEKRKQRQKLFSKRTRKGQPILHNQMTLLLEKIERSHKKNLNKTSNPPTS